MDKVVLSPYLMNLTNVFWKYCLLRGASGANVCLNGYYGVIC
jgi:hypothetical protein